MSKNSNLISIFIPNLTGGGAEHVAVRIANKLAAQGDSVDLVLAQVKGDYLSEVNGKVKIINLNCSDGFSTIKSFPKLIRYLRNNKPSVLFSTLFRANTIAALAVKLSSVNTKLVLRHPNMLYPEGKKDLSFYSMLSKKSAIWAAEKASLVVLTSQAMKRELLKHSSIDSSRVIIIYNPVPIKEIQHKAKNESGHDWLDNKKIPVILAVGRLTYQKNFDSLIKAFAELRKKYESRLIILGEGDERIRLEYLTKELNIHEFVSMPGFSNNPYSYMYRSDVFVLSSRWEGFPNVLVEAMACGVKVVATDCPGGAAEILEYGKYGELIDVDSTDDIVGAIDKVLSGRSQNNAVVRVQDFNIDTIGEKFLSAFHGELS